MQVSKHCVKAISLTDAFAVELAPRFELPLVCGPSTISVWINVKGPSVYHPS